MLALTSRQTIAPLAQQTRRSRAVVRASTEENPKADSYEKLESGMRGAALGVDQVGPDVKDRQNSGDDFLRQDKLNPERANLGAAVGTLDAFRFKGSLPEVANARLAMLGTVAAAVGELRYGQTLTQQVKNYPASIFITMAVITVASLVPMWRGQPRQAAGIFEPNTELVIGRVAMLAFLIMSINCYVRGSMFF